MAHLLTTYARAEKIRRERLISLPSAPLPFVPLEERPTYRRAIYLLRWVVALLAWLILGTALYPQGSPRKPQPYQEPVGSRTNWYEVDKTE